MNIPRCWRNVLATVWDKNLTSRSCSVKAFPPQRQKATRWIIVRFTDIYIHISNNNVMIIVHFYSNLLLIDIFSNVFRGFNWWYKCLYNSIQVLYCSNCQYTMDIHIYVYIHIHMERRQGFYFLNDHNL